jgi:hypothetical protein
MSIAPTYSPSDLLLFTHVLDQIAAEAGGLDEPTRARIGLRIAMGAASGILAVPDLVAFARAGI